MARWWGTIDHPTTRGQLELAVYQAVDARRKKAHVHRGVVAWTGGLGLLVGILCIRLEDVGIVIAPALLCASARRTAAAALHVIRATILRLACPVHEGRGRLLLRADFEVAHRVSDVAQGDIARCAAMTRVHVAASDGVVAAAKRIAPILSLFGFLLPLRHIYSTLSRAWDVRACDVLRGYAPGVPENKFAPN